MTAVRASIPVLRWAVERARLDPIALDKRFPKWHEWLSGEIQPTLKQLEAFAKATHTSLGYFFLPEPPQERLPIPDFRTTVEAELQRPSVDLLDTVYLCQQRQDWFRDYAGMHGYPKLAFVGSVSLQTEPAMAAARIRDVHQFNIAERQQLANWSEALRRFVEQVEAAGVLVMASGVVGSNNRRKLDPQEFRGFALADEVAPLVFINAADTKAAQMFTLAHELAHIWLGESGISDVPPMAPDQRVERWCNQVAAELLMPFDAVHKGYRITGDLRVDMVQLARLFKVSTLVALRRLFDLGAIDRETLWTTYREELDRLRHLDRRTGSGGDFYRTLSVRVSKSFARALVESTLEGQTLFRDAYRLLGVAKPATFEHIAHELGVIR